MKAAKQKIQKVLIKHHGKRLYILGAAGPLVIATIAVWFMSKPQPNAADSQKQTTTQHAADSKSQTSQTDGDTTATIDDQAQNTATTPADDSNKESNFKPQITNTYTSDREELSFTYPSSWQSALGSTHDFPVLQTADGKFNMVFAAPTQSAFTPSCSALSVTFYDVQALSYKNGTGDSLYLVEYYSTSGSNINAGLAVTDWGGSEPKKGGTGSFCGFLPTVASQAQAGAYFWLGMSSGNYDSSYHSLSADDFFALSDVVAIKQALASVTLSN